MGGPVRIPDLYDGRDKSFFFFSWEQLKYATSAPVTNSVPTAAERGGDFSDRLTTTQGGDESLRRFARLRRRNLRPSYHKDRNDCEWNHAMPQPVSRQRDSFRKAE